ncbi:hypothetical protein M0805_005970 [Coniferiporia weirii]|nr:hypothetical protein M0805_005970 [Coniferiporia weirii]
MGRVSTALDARNSPARGKKSGSNKSSFLRSVAFRSPRTPNKERPQRFRLRGGPLRQSPYKRSIFASKTKLHTIREESPQEVEEPHEGRYTCATRSLAAETSYGDCDINGISASEGDESSEVSDFEEWDDETTLVARFQENVSEQSERDKLANLAYQLEGPMQTKGDLLKQYLAHTIAPAARKVKGVHNVLEERVDFTTGVGILSFDDSCKKAEQLSLHDEEDLKRVYMETQRNVRELFQQLKIAYQKRGQLWSELQDSVDKCAVKAFTALSSLPAELDNTVTVIERKAKDVSKPGGIDAKTKQKILRELLAEM